MVWTFTKKRKKRQHWSWPTNPWLPCWRLKNNNNKNIEVGQKIPDCFAEESKKDNTEVGQKIPDCAEGSKRKEKKREKNHTEVGQKVPDFFAEGSKKDNTEVAVGQIPDFFVEGTLKQREANFVNNKYLLVNKQTPPLKNECSILSLISVGSHISLITSHSIIHDADVMWFSMFCHHAVTCIQEHGGVSSLHSIKNTEVLSRCTIHLPLLTSTCPVNMLDPIHIWSGSARKHWPEGGPMIHAHWLASGPDPFGQNLTESASTKLDLGWFYGV